MTFAAPAFSRRLIPDGALTRSLASEGFRDEQIRTCFEAAQTELGRVGEALERFCPQALCGAQAHLALRGEPGQINARFELTDQGWALDTFDYAGRHGPSEPPALLQRFRCAPLQLLLDSLGSTTRPCASVLLSWISRRAFPLDEPLLAFPDPWPPMLSTSARRGWPGWVRELLSAGADPNAARALGRSPLLVSAQHLRERFEMGERAEEATLECCELLLNAGADPLGADDKGRTVLDALGDVPGPAAELIRARAEKATLALEACPAPRKPSATL